MQTLEDSVKAYYSEGFESFEYTSPTSGKATIRINDKQFKQFIYVENSRINFGYVEILRLKPEP